MMPNSAYSNATLFSLMLPSSAPGVLTSALAKLPSCASSQLPLTVTESPDFLHLLSTILVPIAFTLIVIVGFCGNLLVLLVIWCNSQMRTSTNILIFSLALADMLFIVVCVPFTTVIYVNSGWPLGVHLCKLFNYCVYCSAYCSVYTLVCMSLDRYLAIVHPIDSIQWRTERKSLLMVGVVWSVLLLVNLPLLLNSDVITEVELQKRCTEIYCNDLANYRVVPFNVSAVPFLNEMLSLQPSMWSSGTPTRLVNDMASQKMFYTLFFLFGYLLPLTVICVFYGFLIDKLRYGRTARMAQNGEAMRAMKRVSGMVVTVIGVFAISWLPIQIVFLIQVYMDDIESYGFRVVHVLANCFAYANSSVNPILYAFLSENFRRAFTKFLCFGKCGQGSHHHHPQHPNTQMQQQALLATACPTNRLSPTTTPAGLTAISPMTCNNKDATNSNNNVSTKPGRTSAPPSSSSSSSRCHPLNPVHLFRGRLFFLSNNNASPETANGQFSERDEYRSTVHKSDEDNIMPLIIQPKSESCYDVDDHETLTPEFILMQHQPSPNEHLSGSQNFL